MPQPFTITSSSGSVQELHASKILGAEYDETTMLSAPDCMAALNDAVAGARARGPVKLNLDTCLAAGVPLLTPSGLTIDLWGVSIFNRTGLNGPTITNPNWTSSCIGGTLLGDGSRSGFTTDFVGGHIVDKHIAITGRGTIVGNRGNGTTGNCTSGDPRLSAGNASAGVTTGGVAGVPAGMFVAPVAFYGVQDVWVEGLTIDDPPTYGVHLSNPFDVITSGLQIYDPVTLAGGTPDFGRNTAGIQVQGPYGRLAFYNTTVSVNDDSIALNGGDGNLDLGITATAGPQIFGGWSTCYTGPGGDVLTEGMVGINTLNGFRVLCGAYLTDRITFRGFKGTFYGGLGCMLTFGGVPSTGSIGSVLIEDWDVRLTGVKSPGGQFEIEYPSRSLVLRNVVASQDAAGDYTAGLDVRAGTHERIDIQIHNSSSVACNEVPHLKISGGTVRHATVRGSRYRGSGLAASTTPIALVAGGICPDLKLLGVTDDNGGGLVGHTSGTLTNLAVEGCSQDNTAVTGLVTTGTVAVLTGAGNRGVTKTGTFTDATKFASA